MPTQRYKLIIAYRGTNYHGWQEQSLTANYKRPPLPGGKQIPTVQAMVMRAVAEVVRHPVVICGSSRTDSGVHARGQLAHFDTEQTIPVEGLQRAINYALPPDIAVRSIEAVPDSFDAIQSTASKRYQYLVWNAPDRSVFMSDLAWYRWQPLDLPAMKEAAHRFVGRHDFASFTRPRHGRVTTMRTIRGCDVSRKGPRVVIGVEGTGFLWNMVRIMVGTIVEVGLGKYGPDKIDAMLAACDRKAAGPTAPPHGLYLQWIKTK